MTVDDLIERLREEAQNVVRDLLKINELERAAMLKQANKLTGDELIEKAIEDYPGMTLEKAKEYAPPCTTLQEWYEKLFFHSGEDNAEGWL
jgi:hypothetical protein